MKLRSSVRLALLLGWAAVLPLAWSAPTFAQYDVSVSADVPPPPLPVYVQPPIPADGYLWVPGYWAWGGNDYFWVPGYWTLPPEPGLLWTPGYWGWNNGAYVFNPGYWAPTIGFYGGVNYGYGYYGNGFAGGYWRNGSFFYNTAVMNVGAARITNVYVNNVTVNREFANVSYNGGPGGLRVQATPAERAAWSQARIAPTPMQVQHYNAARADGALAASANHGVPPIAATPTAGHLHGPGVTGAEVRHGVVPGGVAPGAPRTCAAVARWRSERCPERSRSAGSAASGGGGRRARLGALRRARRSCLSGLATSGGELRPRRATERGRSDGAASSGAASRAAFRGRAAAGRSPRAGEPSGFRRPFRTTSWLPAGRRLASGASCRAECKAVRAAASRRGASGARRRTQRAALRRSRRLLRSCRQRLSASPLKRCAA